MLRRCYSSKYQENRPTYAGCAVTPEWHSFSVFRQWMINQDWNGKDLDKDILKPGNKIYGPDTCVFVSARLNGFILDCAAARGKWPIGVRRHDILGKFEARCRNPFTGKRDHIGYFKDAEEAHKAWRKRKHALACDYADQQTDPRIANALRNRYAGKPE